MAFLWCVNDGPSLNASLVAFVIFKGILYFMIFKGSYICVIFQGGGSGPPVQPSGSTHVLEGQKIEKLLI